MSKLNNVMIIDDDEITNFIYTKVIRKTKLAEKVEVKTSVKAALAALNSLAQKQDYAGFPDLIFLDINMPVLTGWDFLEAFNKFPEKGRAKTHVMILSSSIYQEDINKAKSYKAVKDYVVKPLTEERMKAIYKKFYG